MKKLQTFTAQEATEMLKINRKTLYELIYSGQIKAFKCGKCFRITEKALDEFINNNAVA